jgi:hypothetical protein
VTQREDSVWRIFAGVTVLAAVVIALVLTLT